MPRIMLIFLCISLFINSGGLLGLYDSGEIKPWDTDLHEGHDTITSHRERALASSALLSFFGYHAAKNMRGSGMIGTGLAFCASGAYHLSQSRSLLKWGFKLQEDEKNRIAEERKKLNRAYSNGDLERSCKDDPNPEFRDPKYVYNHRQAIFRSEESKLTGKSIKYYESKGLQQSAYIAMTCGATLLFLRRRHIMQSYTTFSSNTTRYSKNG